MEEECVERRGWVTREHFLDLVGLTNLIPGPNSTEMAIHPGYLRAGWRGLLLGGLCFLGPPVLITTVLAWLYGRYGALPAVQAFAGGVQPAVFAVIAAAGWRLGRAAVAGPVHALLGAAVALAVLGGAGMLAALFGGTFLGTLVLARPVRGTTPVVDLLSLFLVFLKVGAVLYGSGYVLVAFLEEELVAGRGWLTQPQLLDAIAVGQFTPGPVLSTAAFIGWETAGGAGAAVATLGIFLPSFVFVALLSPLARRLRASAWAAPFLAAVRVAAVALLVAVLVRLGGALVGNLFHVVLAVAAFAGLALGARAPWLILGAGTLGALVG